MSDSVIETAVTRLSRAIAESNPDASSVVLIGIQTGGVHLARSIAAELASQWHREIPMGQLDVAFHRDDLDQRLAPKVHPTSIPFDVTGRNVVLVDDVLFSGRTARAALDALNDLGRPRRIQLAVLIDRGHRELPIQADFVGQRVETGPQDRVDVQLVEGDGLSQVILEKASPPQAP
jgi:pyrimidine operon attenuation protein/uracil phosphoribosyltransferase